MQRLGAKQTTNRPWQWLRSWFVPIKTKEKILYVAAEEIHCKDCSNPRADLLVKHAKAATKIHIKPAKSGRSSLLKITFIPLKKQTKTQWVAYFNRLLSEHGNGAYGEQDLVYVQDQHAYWRRTRNQPSTKRALYHKKLDTDLQAKGPIKPDAITQQRVSFKVSGIPIHCCASMDVEDALQTFLNHTPHLSHWHIEQPLYDQGNHRVIDLICTGNSSIQAQQTLIAAFHQFCQKSDSLPKASQSIRLSTIKHHWWSGCFGYQHDIIVGMALMLLHLTPWHLPTWLGYTVAAYTTLILIPQAKTYYHSLRSQGWRLDMKALLPIVLLTAWTTSMISLLAPLIWHSTTMMHTHFHCIYWLLGMDRWRKQNHRAPNRFKAASMALKRHFPQRHYRLVDTFQQMVAKHPIHIACIEPGQVIAVYPGQTIPVDGIIITPNTTTLCDHHNWGTKKRHTVQENAVVEAGQTYEGANVIQIQATHTHHQSKLSQKLAPKTAEAPLWERQWARWFAITVPILAAAVLVIQGWYLQQLHAAIVGFMSVLVAGCPCTFLTALPYLRSQIRLKCKQNLAIDLVRPESLSQSISHYFLDFAGTLTTLGNATIQGDDPTWKASKLSCWVAAMQQTLKIHLQTHPQLGANAAWCERFIGLSDAQDMPDLKRLGTPQFDLQRHTLTIRIDEQATLTLANNPNTESGRGFIATLKPDNEPSIRGVYHLEEYLKPQVMTWLSKQDDLSVIHIVSGSRRATIERLLPQKVRSKVTIVSDQQPFQKAEYIASILKQPENAAAYGMYMGDGTNDGQAIGYIEPTIRARLSTVVLGNGYLADIHLDPKQHPFPIATIEQINQSYRIEQNRSARLAILYNILSLPMAMMGYLSPMWASIGMSAFSLISWWRIDQIDWQNVFHPTSSKRITHQIQPCRAMHHPLGVAEDCAERVATIR